MALAEEVDPGVYPQIRAHPGLALQGKERAGVVQPQASRTLVGEEEGLEPPLAMVAQEARECTLTSPVHRSRTGTEEEVGCAQEELAVRWH